MANGLAEYEEKFSENQLKALTLFTSGAASQHDVARKLKVDDKTISKWCQNSEFREARRNLLMDTFESLSGKAVKVLEEQLESDNAWVRLNAARIVLDKVLPNMAAQEAKTIINFQMPQPAMPPPPEIIEAEDSGVE